MSHLPKVGFGDCQLFSVEWLARQGGIGFNWNGRPIPRPSGLRTLSKNASLRRYQHNLGMTALIALKESRQHWTTHWPLTGKVFLGVTFRLESKAESKPDLSNLLKAVEDSCTGVLYSDDAQIVGYLPGTMKLNVLAGEGLTVVLLPEGTMMHRPMNIGNRPLVVEP